MKLMEKRTVPVLVLVPAQLDHLILSLMVMVQTIQSSKFHPTHTDRPVLLNRFDSDTISFSIVLRNRERSFCVESFLAHLTQRVM